MPHDVFISYATPDKKAADAVCASLEQKGIRCCIFPRDGIPGKSFAETITEFMASCKVVVLMLSSHANASKHISREVEMAVRRGLTVIPFRIENVQPSGSLEYWIAEAHWLDAITPELERGLEKLAEWVLPHVSVVKRPVEPALGPARDDRQAVAYEILGDTLDATAARLRTRAAAAGEMANEARPRPMYCRKCGTRSQPGARFCRQCGTEVLS